VQRYESPLWITSERGARWPDPAIRKWPERAMPDDDPRDGIGGVRRPDRDAHRYEGVIMSAILSTASTPAGELESAVERRARASTAFGRKRGYYRLLFEAGPVDAATFAELAGVTEHQGRAWLEEQVAAGVLRVVAGPTGGEELLLPGEFVPVLLGDHGEPELEGARALLAEHRAEVERVRAFADAARLSRVV
jgi:hypothetical protein